MNSFVSNYCAKCGVPIVLGNNLCDICTKHISDNVNWVPCIACGTSNPSNLSYCEFCGAPLLEGTMENTENLTDMYSSAPNIRFAELEIMDKALKHCIDTNKAESVVVKGDGGMGISTVLNDFCENSKGKLSAQRLF